MGSEVSSNRSKKSQLFDTMELTMTASEELMVPLPPRSKPTRSVMYADDFYCPVVNGCTRSYDQDFPDSPNDSEMRAVSEYSGTEANSNRNLGFFQLESVDIVPNNIELKSICTNTSQPTYTETAAGNSQGNLMMTDCATGMSQERIVSTVDCGIQTSQELIFVGQPCMQKDETSVSLNKVLQQPRKRYPLTNKQLIVFPRVTGQTTAPEIPAKIPRLDDLDEDIVMNPIYSSGVTFDFVESDKENDRSVLRQRGNVEIRMSESSDSALAMRPAGKHHHKDELTSSSSNELISSRGPYLRVGLSKKSRARNPLHPRSFR